MIIEYAHGNKNRIDFGYNGQHNNFVRLVKLTWSKNQRTKKLAFKITLHHNTTWNPDEAEMIAYCLAHAVVASDRVEEGL